MTTRRMAYWLFLLAWGGGCQNQNAFQGPPLRVVADVNAIRVIVPTHERGQDVQALLLSRAEYFVNRCRAPLNCIITDDEAQTQDLSDYHLVVFGTPQGNSWLQGQMEALPVALGLDRVITGMLHAGPHLGFITCWPHPANPNRGVLIFTAHQAESVGAYRGPLDTDYVVTRRDRVIEAEDYIKDKDTWTFPVWALTSTQASNDLTRLFDTIESVHPEAEKPWKGGSYSQFKAVCQVESSKLVNDEKIIPRADFHRQLGLVCASYQDGHTQLVVEPTVGDTSDSSLRMLPFRLRHRAGAFYVGQSVDLLKHIEGHQIIAINQRSLLDSLQPVLRTISGERLALRIERFIQKQRTYWTLTRPAGEDLMDLTVADPNGEESSYVIDLMSLADYDALLSPYYGGPTETLRFYEERKVAYLDCGPYFRGGQSRQDLADVFQAIQDHGSTHLILDLRCDGGRHDQVVTPLMSYLMDRPSLVYSQADTKISSELLAQGQAKDYRKRVGEVISTLYNPEPLESHATRFAGTLFVLIGAKTFGVAADLAAVLKDYERGTLVGSETGGVREHFAWPHTLTLAHSGFKIEVSTGKLYPPLPRPDDDRRGTVPDIELTSSLLAPHFQEADPSLSFLLTTLGKRLEATP